MRGVKIGEAVSTDFEKVRSATLTFPAPVPEPEWAEPLLLTPHDQERTLSQHSGSVHNMQLDPLRNLTLSIAEEVRRFVGKFASRRLDERLGLLSVVFLSAWRSKG